MSRREPALRRCRPIVRVDGRVLALPQGWDPSLSRTVYAYDVTDAVDPKATHALVDETSARAWIFGQHVRSYVRDVRPDVEGVELARVRLSVSVSYAIWGKR